MGVKTLLNFWNNPEEKKDPKDSKTSKDGTRPTKEGKGTHSNNDDENLHDSWAVRTPTQNHRPPLPSLPSQASLHYPPQGGGIVPQSTFPSFQQPTAPPQQTQSQQLMEWNQQFFPMQPQQIVLPPLPQGYQNEDQSQGYRNQDQRYSDNEDQGPPLSGEERMFEAVLDVASQCDKIANNMKSYQYPSRDEVRIRLQQKGYTSGGMRQRAATAEGKVQYLRALPAKIGEVQELCFLNDMYVHLFNTDKIRQNQLQLQSLYNRREEQRKLKLKRDRERKRREVQRINEIDELIDEVSDRHWKNRT